MSTTHKTKAKYLIEVSVAFRRDTKALSSALTFDAPDRRRPTPTTGFVAAAQRNGGVALRLSLPARNTITDSIAISPSAVTRDYPFTTHDRSGLSLLNRKLARARRDTRWQTTHLFISGVRYQRMPVYRRKSVQSRL